MNFSKGDYLTFEQTHRGERSVTGRVVKAAASFRSVTVDVDGMEYRFRRFSKANEWSLAGELGLWMLSEKRAESPAALREFFQQSTELIDAYVVKYPGRFQPWKPKRGRA